MISFSRETPARFKKEIAKAAFSVSPEACRTGEIAVDKINPILENIGRKKDCLTDEELDAILLESNDRLSNKRFIPIDMIIKQCV
mmetsp:Transcript_29437/g.44477  ORF Transcript_29437/g.44477 Transcript_29437/m.44477 type:complete len:85 (+) Transcript_29437:374-628(+)